MSRLLIHVEGETEETFVKEILRPHLAGHGYLRVDARLLGNTRLRSQRGGIRPWTSARADIIRHLSEDKACLATTMVDYYGLPQGEGRAWPGRQDAALAPFHGKAQVVESAIMADLARSEEQHLRRRFLPFVVMHEFEALLFSDCTTFAHSLGIPALAPEMQRIRDQVASPEEINDSPLTAPSKRIERLVPGYQKPLFGNIAALDIGLPAMRKACPHFDDWVSRLETWPQHRRRENPED